MCKITIYFYFNILAPINTKTKRCQTLNSAHCFRIRCEIIAKCLQHDNNNVYKTIYLICHTARELINFIIFLRHLPRIHFKNENLDLLDYPSGVTPGVISSRRINYENSSKLLIFPWHRFQYSVCVSFFIMFV